MTPTTERRSVKDLRGDTRLVQMLRSAVDAAKGDEGWANLASVGNQVGNQASFDSRNYGYPKLRNLIEAIGLFKVKHEGQGVWVRRKVAVKSATKAATTSA